MKKILILQLLLLSFVFNGNSQYVRLSDSDKNKIKDLVIPVLQNCISSFDGKYLPGTTVISVYFESESQLEIRGKVSYHGEQCGDVRNRDYKIKIFEEGSQKYGETCIYSPFCILGMVTSEEWDCACRKWQYGSDETINNALKLFQLIKEIYDSN